MTNPIVTSIDSWTNHRVEICENPAATAAHEAPTPIREIGVVLDPREATKVRQMCAALTKTLLHLQARRETFYLQVKEEDGVLWDWTRDGECSDQLWMLGEGQPLALTSLNPLIEVVDENEDTFTVDLAAEMQVGGES